MNGDRNTIADLARRVRAIEDRLRETEAAAQPPSLREQVAKAWCAAYYGEFSGSAKAPDDMQMQSADAVLAVVADWLAAQPMPYPDVVTRGQRDHDVRLLRGQS